MSALEIAKRGIELADDATSAAFSPRALVEIKAEMLGYFDYAAKHFAELASAHIMACEALEKMRARDERNSSLPIWYREQIDAALGPLCEDCPPRRYPTDKTRCASCPRRADALSCSAPPPETGGSIAPTLPCPAPKPEK